MLLRHIVYSHKSLTFDTVVCHPSTPVLVLLKSTSTQVILTNKIAFKISAKVFSLILDIFLYHDFSVNNFTNAFKVSDASGLLQ